MISIIKFETKKLNFQTDKMLVLLLVVLLLSLKLVVLLVLLLLLLFLTLLNEQRIKIFNKFFVRTSF
jgi:hypothetical protein